MHPAIFGSDYELEDGIFTRVGGSVGRVYSDGDEVENRIFNVVQEATDRSLFSPELASAIIDWPSAYHLSPIRANILRPFEPIFAGKWILEIGAGCGILTRYLAELGCRVIAVEASRRRAKILRARTADLDNVAVVCDNINTFTCSLIFDVVLSIGVLEYSRIYSENELVFIEKARSLLKKTGILLIAIENQLGLKYFCGAREDHLGQKFVGINDRYDRSGVVTFGRRHLATLLDSAGFTHKEWYIPCPDYKLPATIIMGDCAEICSDFDAGTLMAQSVLLDANKPERPLFSMERALNVVHKNKLGLELANSLLVAARLTPPPPGYLSDEACLAWHYGGRRCRPFVCESRFLIRAEGIFVERRRIYEDESCYPIVHTPRSEQYIVGKNWWMELVELVNRPLWTVNQVSDWAQTWIDALLWGIGLGSSVAVRDLIDGKFVDATPFNMIVGSNGEAQFFDAEWRPDWPIDFGFVLWRGIQHSLGRISSVEECYPGTPISIRDLVKAILENVGYPITDELQKKYEKMEAEIQQVVAGYSVQGPSCDGRLFVRNSAELDGQLSIAQSERDRLMTQVNRLERKLTAVYTSISWKLTKPFRTFTRFWDEWVARS